MTERRRERLSYRGWAIVGLDHSVYAGPVAADADTSALTFPSALTFQRVHHVSINVTDVDESVAFYRDVLELESLVRPPFGFAGAWFSLGEQQLHLIEAADFVAPVGQHFALYVDDIAATIEVLVDRGVDVSRVSEIPGVCRQAFFADPTGNSIELNQPLAVG
jgi:catechol 2,3-dioxygenase-like lactoylglutathione lyase family enzyme